MTSAQELSTLRDLQRLIEERAKAEHAGAIKAKKSASKALEESQARLVAGDAALARYSDEPDFELHQFQILASLVNQFEDDVHAKSADHSEVCEREANARTRRQREEKLTDHLSDQLHQTTRKERRKAEDRKAREFLSIRAARTGAAK